MFRKTLYRSLLLSALVCGGVILGGCGDMGKDQDALKEQEMTRWNLTRIAIIFQLAEQQYKVGDYEKCRQTLQEAFSAKVPFAPLNILAAKVDMETGTLEPAAENLKTAIQINPADAEPYYLLGVLYQRWQKYEVARDYYKDAWAHKPEQALYMLAEVEMEITLGHLDAAQQILEAKLVYFEQSAAVRVALARIATLKNDYPAACKHYREAVTLTPDDKKLRRSYAEALYFSNKYAEAAPMFEEMRENVEPEDRANVVTMLGQCYMNLRRYPEARNCFQEVIRYQPDDLLASIALGKACIQTGDLGIATTAARRVLKAEPENTQAMILLALIQQKQKKWSDAQVTLEKAAKIAPEDSTLWCMLGVNAQQLGNRQAALAFYEKAVEANPGDSWASELLNHAQPAAPSSKETPAALPEKPAAANTAVSTDGDQAVAASPMESKDP